MILVPAIRGSMIGALTSDGGRQVLPQHARVPRRDSEQRQRRSLRAPATLFPIAQRMDTDSQRVGKLLLGEPDEASKRNDVLAPCKLSAKNTFALSLRHRAGEVPVGQFTNLVAHVSLLRIPRSVRAHLWSPSAHSRSAGHHHHV